MAFETSIEEAWSPAPCRTPQRASLAAVRQSLGVTYRAIRHYEQLGLIDCGRDARGTRWLDETAVARLAVIRDLRRAGVSVRRVAQIVLANGDITPAVVDELRVQARAAEAQHSRIQGLIADWARAAS
jgi:DNA-binding transcriptional MerR regulator